MEAGAAGPGSAFFPPGGRSEGGGGRSFSGGRLSAGGESCSWGRVSCAASDSGSKRRATRQRVIVGEGKGLRVCQKVGSRTSFSFAMLRRGSVNKASISGWQASASLSSAGLMGKSRARGTRRLPYWPPVMSKTRSAP